MELKKGFYPALGTPMDKEGKLVEDSFRKQIDLMIKAGTSGVLCMGSMGAQQVFDSKEYARIAKVAADEVNGRVPLFIGAMDNSVFRVKERFEAIKDLNFDAVVLTTPFYSTTSAKNLIKFFQECADIAPKPVYLYDLAVVTKQKITFDMVKVLSKHPNIKGIKTGDAVLVRLIERNIPGFNTLFSNIDIFDIGGAYGFPRVLDGMFTCVPKNAAEFQKAYIAGDMKTAGKYLDNIVNLRDVFIASGGIWPAYTYAMNLIGLDGEYGHGYGTSDMTNCNTQMVKDFMKEIGEI